MKDMNDFLNELNLIQDPKLDATLAAYAAKINQVKLSGSLRETLLSHNPRPKRNLNYETDGFLASSSLYTIESISLLITSFIAIFQNAGYLSQDDHDENFSVLEKLFTGQSLKDINRIKWNDQSEDKRKTGNNTWKQLYYIFYQLYFSEIISFDVTHGIKKAISYRLLNAFISATNPTVREYKEIDSDPLGRYLSRSNTKDSRDWLILEIPDRQIATFGNTVASLIALYCKTVKIKRPV